MQAGLSWIILYTPGTVRCISQLLFLFNTQIVNTISSSQSEMFYDNKACSLEVKRKLASKENATQDLQIGM